MERNGFFIAVTSFAGMRNVFVRDQMPRSFLIMMIITAATSFIRSKESLMYQNSARIVLIIRNNSISLHLLKRLSAGQSMTSTAALRTAPFSAVVVVPAAEAPAVAAVVPTAVPTAAVSAAIVVPTTGIAATAAEVTEAAAATIVDKIRNIKIPPYIL